MTRKPYNKNRYDNLESIVASSYSYADVLRALDIVPAGGNYSTLKQRIEELNLDTTHFTGKGWSKGKTLPYRPKVSLEEVLVKDRPTDSSHLRARLIREGIKDSLCETCKLVEWMGNPIPLELEHIDGDHTNNELSNLKLLCPNCHSMTEHYRGRAKISKKYQRLKAMSPIHERYDGL